MGGEDSRVVWDFDGGGYGGEIVSVGCDERGGGGVVADEEVEKGRGDDGALGDSGLDGFGRGYCRSIWLIYL